LNQERANGIFCGSRHSAIIVKGNLKTFGCGRFGQLGHMNSENIADPKTVMTLKGKLVKIVACGANFTICSTAVGEVYSWGFNRWHQLGISDSKTTIVNQPTQITELVGIKSIRFISVGRYHSILVTGKSDIYSWGVSKAGQVGEEFKKRNKDRPLPIPRFFTGEIIGMSSGNMHNVALTSVGELYEWGYLSDDHLGMIEPNEVYFHPKLLEVVLDSPVAKINAGGFHSALITESGSLYTWGFAFGGRLGHSEDKDCIFTGEKSALKPQLVESLKGKKITEVACGGAHTIVIAEKEKK